MRSQKSTFKYWKNLRKQRRWKLKRRHFWWFTTTVFYSSSGKMKIWSLIFASVGALIRWLQELRRLMLETFATGRVQIFCAKRGERKQLNLIFRLTTLETDGCCCCFAPHATNTAVKSHQILCTKLIHLHVWAGDEQITLQQQHWRQSVLFSQHCSPPFGSIWAWKWAQFMGYH